MGFPLISIIALEASLHHEYFHHTSPQCSSASFGNNRTPSEALFAPVPLDQTHGVLESLITSRSGERSKVVMETNVVGGSMFVS